jgi:hypothetical protein
VPLPRLCDPALLRSLADRGLELLAAVRPGQSDAAARLVHACRDAGVRVFAWPMLSDADGRWASTENADRFARFVLDLLADLEHARALPDGLALDLEPPIGRVRRLLRGRADAMRPPAHEDVGGLQRICDGAQALGLEVLAAVVPLVLVDRAEHDGWQHLLGTPLPHAGIDTVSPMLYSSLATGYSRGVLRRGDVRGLLHACALACVQRFGARASASLGVAGTGALGDEQLLEGPSQLADDVALCRAAGIEDIALFDLGGVLRRGSPERWFDALLHTQPAVAPPPLTPRARLALATARGVGTLAQASGNWGRIWAAKRAARKR